MFSLLHATLIEFSYNDLYGVPPSLSGANQEIWVEYEPTLTTVKLVGAPGTMARVKQVETVINIVVRTNIPEPISVHNV